MTTKTIRRIAIASTARASKPARFLIIHSPQAANVP
jgi:hypothetical protein